MPIENKIQIAVKRSLHDRITALQTKLNKYNDGFISKPDTIIFLFRMWRDLQDIIDPKGNNPEEIIKKMRGY